MFHEAGIPHDDASYTGDVSTSPVSLDYYREKARQFQSTLNQLDQGLRAAYIAEAAHINPEFDAEMRGYINEIEDKKFQLRTTAQAINAGAALINAAGGRFPVLSVPSGLSAFLPAIPVAAIAAIGAATALITWGAQLVSGLNDRLLWAAKTQGLTDTQRADLLEAQARAEAAANATSIFSGMVGAGKLVMYGAFAVAGWLIWRELQKRR